MCVCVFCFVFVLFIGRTNICSKTSWSEGERVQPMIFEAVLAMRTSCDLARADKFPYKDVMLGLTQKMP